MSLPLVCRFAEPRDVPGIEQLWREETPWGPLGDLRQEWFRQNPCEGSMAVIATDTNERVVGQTIFMAYRIWINGREYRAVRPLASIVSQEWRSSLAANASEHPAMLMYKFGLEAAHERGDALVFMLPNPLW